MYQGSSQNTNYSEDYDIVVIGSGAAGLSAAVTAKLNNLSVIVIEKEDLFGGTTARSGGVLWIPGNSKFPNIYEQNSNEAKTYLKNETKEFFDEKKIDIFLKYGPEMVQFMEKNTSYVRFNPAQGFSDYHPDQPGGLTNGRSIAAQPVDGTILKKELTRLRPPLKEITLFGMMLNASEDVKHFFNATKSLLSFKHVTKLLLKYIIDIVRFRRSMRLTNGNALIARLAQSYFDLKGEIRTSTKLIEILKDGNKVTGVKVQSGNKEYILKTNKALILATGGFPLDSEKKKKLFPHEKNGGEHLSPAGPGNTGDGINLMQRIGAQFVDNIPNAAAWIPVSKIPDKKNIRVFPHLIDRYKPGVIMVNDEGTRFTNESDSYHDVGQAMQINSQGTKEVYAWLITDHRSLRKYGLGFVKPAPLPIFSYVNNGYLIKANTINELALKLNVPEVNLLKTLSKYNIDAKSGVDTEFNKGSTAYNRFLGDPEHKPNPCIAPIITAPFYAIRTVIGDLGTFAGVKTNEYSQVIDLENKVIDGIYAVGNDALSIMGGNYPGGGITLGPGMTFGYTAVLHITNLLGD